MSAEKFFLLLETIISHLTDGACHPDGAPKVVSRARHVPIETSTASGEPGETRRPLPSPQSGSMATKNTDPNEDPNRR